MRYTAIIDYGVGNLKSVANAMTYIGHETKIANVPEVLEAEGDGDGKGTFSSSRPQADLGHMPGDAVALRLWRRGAFL